MSKTFSNIIATLFLASILTSCKYVAKNTVKLSLDAALLSQPSFCKEKTLSVELGTLYEPAIVGNNIGIFNGNIYQFGSEPIHSISISDTNSNWVDKTRKSLFSDKETVDAAQKTYEDYISGLKIDNLCHENKNAASINSLNEKIKTNSYSRILIFSKNIGDSVWNNYPVYKDILILKDRLVEIYEESKGASVLIIIDPISIPAENTELITDTIGTNTNETSISSPNTNYGDIKAILKKISNQSSSENERKQAVNEAMATIFSKHLEVETYINEFGKSPHPWDKGHGRKYLESLIDDRSILDFKIISATRNKDDGKVNYLQVVQIHNY